MANIQVSRRIPELDGLRGLAILQVVFFHYVFCSESNDDSLLGRFIRDVFPLSWSGVDLFFVISGFLIGGILIDGRDAGNYFRIFFIRRVCRIIPLYFLWLALFLVLAGFLSSFAGNEWYETTFLQKIPEFPQWGYLLFLQNFYIAKTNLFGSSWLAATWSLAVEEQFYLLLPLVIWLIPPRQILKVLVFVILLVPVFRLFLYLNHPAIFSYVLLPCRADALLLGVVCACFIRQKNIRSLFEKNQEWLYLAFGILLLGVGYLTSFASRQDVFMLYNSFEMISLGYSWMAMFYACLLLIVVTGKRGPIIWAARLPLLRHFGIIAYGIFLMHMAMKSLANGLILGKENSSLNGLSATTVAILAFLVTWILAALSWHFLEKPVIDWGHSVSCTSRKIYLAK